MPRVPFIGRLFWAEYLSLFASLLLIFVEGVLRLITLCLPDAIIRFFYRQSKSIFNTLSSSQNRSTRRPRTKQRTLAESIAQTTDFSELCELYGYETEEHIVQTGDGYLLGLHRLPYRRGEEGEYVNTGKSGVRKKVVYLHHGLLMNSEVWVCLTDEQRCLPFQLVERGYDVWLGNNRGNKYSKKSTKSSPASIDFWDFSIDEFAFHDIPNSIEYILGVTEQPSLSYIGFSQGTAQAFAALSIHPTLNQRVDVFVALAPAMSPAGLYNGIVDSLMKASPQFVFLAFGRKSILSSTTMWQAILYPPIFVRIIDISLRTLFNWTGDNISQSQKLAAYPHLYSFTSTKSVVHWFQIIRNRAFQMYDDEVGGPLAVGTNSRYYKPVRYPTKNIKSPIVLLYGANDSLVDIGIMLRELPRKTIVREIPKYEHLDFLWATDVDEQVFHHVYEALDQHASGKSTASFPSRLLLENKTNGYSEDEAIASGAVNIEQH
ncbi:esterase / lipase [Talaromyces islandicus]|uniref:Esterase / lipase n=1 Tax=Talaromyces islandicus TaxID=28573 RepID=A0A0U1LWU7_TALIS|nr:esterase / lipase [Talaromyces islandicus]